MAGTTNTSPVADSRLLRDLHPAVQMLLWRNCPVSSTANGDQVCVAWAALSLSSLPHPLSGGDTPGLGETPTSPLDRGQCMARSLQMQVRADGCNPLSAAARHPLLPK